MSETTHRAHCGQECGDIMDLCTHRRGCVKCINAIIDGVFSGTHTKAAVDGDGAALKAEALQQQVRAVNAALDRPEGEEALA